MAGTRQPRSLVSRRRRLADDGEEDDALIIHDSQSEASGHSGVDDLDEEDHQDDIVTAGDATDASAAPASGTTSEPSKKPRKAQKSRRKKKNDAGQRVEAASTQVEFKASADTEVMQQRRDLKDANDEDTAVDFGHTDVGTEQLAKSSRPAQRNGLSTTQGPPGTDQQQRRRAPNPAHIPNRGAFFMHDTRARNDVVNGTRGGLPSRARNGEKPEIKDAPIANGQALRQDTAAEQPWKHDLHETINEEPAATPNLIPAKHHTSNAAAAPHASVPPQVTTTSFSSTKLLYKVQIRVKLPGTDTAKLFPDVPWKAYTRLPNHRPPLRRDKAVRISLPPNFQRFIFPSVDRSFIFIPRQMRPNQQNHSRHHYQQMYGGGFSSRRTSMYGGSVYSPSIAASRRSSITGMSRVGAFSPATFGNGHAYGRPVVRLPTHSQPSFSRHPSMGGQGYHSYPPPQQPAFQGTPTNTVHQPRPQKQISVTDIEYPAALQQASSMPDSQLFHTQLPVHAHEQNNYAHYQGQSYGALNHQHYPSQTSGVGEPNLYNGSNAYHNPPYHNGYVPQHQYYYPPYSGNSYNTVSMYGPGHMSQATTVPSPPSAGPPAINAQPQSGMVAHESNGMVFYMPASEVQNTSQAETYQPAESFVPSYAMPGLLPPTPAPDTSYMYPSDQMQGLQPQMYYPRT